ncbi:hypothetical protein Agub_g14572, partial [Astrephomene gubernaculifera]
MSLLSLYANIIWRGNGPGEVYKRKVAASLISRYNAPQPLAEFDGLAPGSRDTDDRILSSDPCFHVVDGAVRLHIEKLLFMAKARLEKWLDLAFPPHNAPDEYLKNCLARYIIAEQERMVYAPPSSLFTLDMSSAETMLDAYWTDAH